MIYKKNNLNLGSCMVLMLMSLLGLIFGNFSIPVIGISVYTIVILTLKSKDIDEIKVLNIIVIINIFTIVFIYFIYLNRYGAPYYIGGSDDLNYEKEAYDTLRTLGLFNYSSIRGTIVSEFHNSVGYIYILAWIMRISELIHEYHTIISRIINGILLAVMAIVARRYCIKNINLSKELSNTVSYIIGLSPVMLYISSHVFRDTMVSLIIFSNFYLLSNLSKDKFNKKAMTYIIVAMSFIVIKELRLQTTYILIGIIILTYMFRKNNSKYNFKKNIFAIISLALITMIIPNIIEKYTHFQHWYADSLQQNSMSGLSYYIFAIPMPVGLIPRMLYLSIYPTPSISPNLELIVLGIGTIFQIFCIPYVIIGVIRIIKNKTYLDLLSIFLIIYIMIASTTFTFRHIAMFYPFAVIIGVYGYEHVKSKNKVKISIIIMYGMVVSMGVLYTILKLT